MARYVLTCCVLSLLVSAALARDDIDAAVTHGSQASAHSAASALHALAASGRVILGATAVPLLIGGSVSQFSGQVSTQMGEELMRAATAPIGEPLPITQESFSVGPPPDQALRAPTGQGGQ